jgi:hypothetical protein
VSTGTVEHAFAEVDREHPRPEFCHVASEFTIPAGDFKHSFSLLERE